MNRLRATWRQTKLLTMAASCWLALHGMALAAPAKPGPEAPATGGGPSQYVAPYAVVLLGIGLGLLFVCNSSRRRDRAPQKYGE